MTSPKIDWANLAERAEEKHAFNIAKLESKVEQDSRLKKEAAQFMQPFEDFLDAIQSVGFVNSRVLTYNRVGYDSGYELHVVIADMHSTQMDLKKITNPDKGLMDNALRINCMSESVFLNTVHSKTSETEVLGYGSIESAKEVLIEWIIQRHPELLVELAKIQMAKPPQARL